MPQIATNPKTGERLQWDGKAWTPVSQPQAATKPSPFRQPSATEIASGPGGLVLGRAGELAGAGVEGLERGSLRSEAAGNRGTAFAKRALAEPLRTVESAGRIGAGMMHPLNQAAAATAIAAPPTAPYIAGAYGLSAIPGLRGQKKGESQPEAVERRLLSSAQLAGSAAGVGEARVVANKVAKAKFANISSMLEDFRKTVEKKPAKGMMDVAHVKFRDLASKLDSMWEPLHAKLEKVPVNPETVGTALKKLKGIRPELDRWVDEMMPYTKSGEAQRAPLWGEAKKLNEKLWELQGKDKVVSSLAQQARQVLSTALEDTAKAAGLGPDYLRAKSLTRKLENVKFHTAYRAIKVAPATWEIGGAAAGAMMGEALGPAGMLGGMYAGHHLGRALGKRFATEPEFKVPQESIEGARSLYRDLGKEPPTDLGKRRVKVVPERAGSTAGAKADTGYMDAAKKKLGPSATIHDIVAEAQRMKDAAKAKK